MRKLTYLAAFVLVIITGCLMNPGRATAETWKPICSVATAKGGTNTWKQLAQAGAGNTGSWKKLGDCGPPPPPPTCDNGATDYPTCTPDFVLDFPDRFYASTEVALTWSYGRLTADIYDDGLTSSTTYQLAQNSSVFQNYGIRFTLLSMKSTNGGQMAYFSEDYTIGPNMYYIDDTYRTGFSTNEIYGAPDGTGPPVGTTVVRTYRVDFIKWNGGVFSKTFKVAIGSQACCVF